MNKHTSGPWQVVPASKAQSPWIVGDREGGSVADCEPSGPWMRNEEADANARLIAAAPDMLAVLRGVKTTLAIHGLSKDHGVIVEIDAVIAKATTGASDA